MSNQFIYTAIALAGASSIVVFIVSVGGAS